MPRRWIANSLLAICCLSVLLPLEVVAEIISRPACCCCRGAHHHCDCCAGRKPTHRGPGFQDSSRRCPCGSRIRTRTVRDGLPEEAGLGSRSRYSETSFRVSSDTFRSNRGIHQSERGPPILAYSQALPPILVCCREQMSILG